MSTDDSLAPAVVGRSLASRRMLGTDVIVVVLTTGLNDDDDEWESISWLFVQVVSTLLLVAAAIWLFGEAGFEQRLVGLAAGCGVSDMGDCIMTILRGIRRKYPCACLGFPVKCIQVSKRCAVSV